MRTYKRRQALYSTTDETFIETVKSSHSVAQVLSKLGLNGTGGSRKVFQKRIQLLKLDISHFTGQAHLRGRTHDWGVSIPLDEILVENSFYNCYKLKARLIKTGLLQMKCSECGLENQWNNKPIKLQMDHINGINTDNRLENLRILCPNCHSQTTTFCAKNKKIKPVMIITKKTCGNCGNILKDQRAKLCSALLCLL